MPFVTCSKMFSKQYKSFVFLLLVFDYCESARILGVFTVASVSHQIVFQPIWRELSLRGHQVTVLTPNPLNDPTLTNLTEIDLSFQYKILEQFKPMMSQGLDHWSLTKQMTSSFTELVGLALRHEGLINLIKDDSAAFDVVLAEVMDPTTYAFAAKFKCPLVGIASLNALNPTHAAVGNPGHPILLPDFSTPYFGGGHLSFFEKLDAVLFYFYQKYVYDAYLYPTVDERVKKHFGADFPSVKDIEKNMSLLLLNTNPILNGPKVYGPNVIEFGGGVHLKPKKPLPKELKSFLDNSPEGVIYFSLGSNVKSAYLPERLQKTLIDTFAELPYKVLWKFEEDELKNKPKNVKISKWLPQQDLLGHPNIKLFITQAGLQSFEEAVLNGVPLLALPFIADQYGNARRIVNLGLGLNLDFKTLTKDTLLKSVLEIIGNAKYKEKAVQLGKVLKDQPMTGVDKAIWWTEYVIRNKGAPYLRNPRADVSWCEFLVLDVVAFLFSIIALTLLAVYKILRFIIYVVHSKRGKRKIQ